MRGEMSGHERSMREHSFSFSSAQKPTPYIGVITAPVPAVLASQLGLPEGFGIVVEDVLPDGPAAGAGLQKFDVLKDVNDQHLIDPGQLSALLRSYGKDAQITLTLSRKGQEQKVTLKVGERMLPERHALNSGMGEFPFNVTPATPAVGFDDQARRFQERVRGFQEKMAEFQKRMQAWSKNPSSGPPPEAPRLDPSAPNAPTPQRAPGAPRPQDLLRQAQPGGAREVRVDQDGNVTTWSTADASVVVKDDNGEVAVRTVDGHRVVTAKNPAGETVFTGPVDTDEQRQALPEPVRKKLAEIQIRADGGTATAAAEAAAGEVKSLEDALHLSPPPPAEREVQ